MTSTKEPKLHGDRIMLATVALLLAVGVIMISSASSVVGYSRYGDTWYFLKKQVSWILLGTPLALLAGTMSLITLRRFSRIMALPMMIILPLIPFLPGIGVQVKGATRWIRMAGFTFQPAELAKLALVLYLAHVISKKGNRMQEFIPGMAVPMALAGLVAGGLILQPDLGNALMIIVTGMALLFLGGARLSHLAVPLVAGMPILYLLISRVQYRLDRVLAFLDPFADPQGSGFQLVQSFIAFGSGGLMGKGLGESGQKLFYLPEAHTDFVFSILGEELGLWGTTSVVILFGILFIRGALTALEAPDLYTSLLAWGLTILLVMPGLLSMMVTTGLLPTKGLPMPFVSYGGSSLVVCMIIAGLLYNLSRANAVSRFS